MELHHATPVSAAGVAFLGSGSKGNCSLVYADGRGVLVDCGFSATEAARRITRAGLAGVRIEALLLTHEHTDHVGGARVLSRRLGIPVFATRGTACAARPALAGVPDVVELRAGDSVVLAGVEVRAFATSHDASEPVGYAFTTPRGRIGIATDTGVLTGDAAEVLADCDLLGLESNHDLGMLESGPYPLFLKRRILSDRGHMSNDAAAAALGRLTGARTRTVCALHLSEQNNTHALARETLRVALERLGVTARVHVAPQHTALHCTL